MSHFGVGLPLGYVDPGSGTLALQMLIAGVAGAAMMLRIRIASLFTRKKDKPVKSD